MKIKLAEVELVVKILTLPYAVRALVAIQILLTQDLTKATT